MARMPQLRQSDVPRQAESVLMGIMRFPLLRSDRSTPPAQAIIQTSTLKVRDTTPDQTLSHLMPIAPEKQRAGSHLYTPTADQIVMGLAHATKVRDHLAAAHINLHGQQSLMALDRCKVVLARHFAKRTAIQTDHHQQGAASLECQVQFLRQGCWHWQGRWRCARRPRCHGQRAGGRLRSSAGITWARYVR